MKSHLRIQWQRFGGARRQFRRLTRCDATLRFRLGRPTRKPAIGAAVLELLAIDGRDDTPSLYANAGWTVTLARGNIGLQRSLREIRFRDSRRDKHLARIIAQNAPVRRDRFVRGAADAEKAGGDESSAQK
jgi:hypothetical protein